MSQSVSKLTRSALCVLMAFACALFVPAVAHADLQATGVASLQEAETQEVQSTSDEQAIEMQDAEELSIQEAALTHIGIDVSTHQGSINWKSVASTNVKFAIIRCGQRTNFDDTRWLENVKGCQAANLPFGVYLFSEAKTTTAAAAEADHVKKLLDAAGLNQTQIAFPIYLDIEDYNGNGRTSLSQDENVAIFKAFKERLNGYGYSKIGIYASASVWASSLSTIDLASEYRWVAAYNNTGPYYSYPSIASKGCGVWQNSSTGKVNGISGNVDMDKARSDIRFLEQSGDTRNMFRLYNPNTGEHFYTASALECGYLEGVGWRYESVGWQAPKSSGIPVYRLYNPNAPGGDHHYTTNKEEYDNLVKVGWRGESIAWYSAWIDQVATYRLYNPNAKSGTHHYTASEAERDHLVSLGWKAEGRAWYGLK